MTTTNTPSVIKVNTDSVLKGDVFYGTFDTTVKNKRVRVMVSNHLKDANKEYEFRIANKCQAGFINIHDTKGTPSGMMGGWSKNSLVRSFRWFETPTVTLLFFTVVSKEP